ncbi:hypothetical protein AYJ57_19110 [Salipiger sp. CCB-MM3]|uniref:GntR family transcriptional regulator n=1 Tax=Salipiger sp. CCB-MM3 TaxID=1792508 RepID=UPI00080A9607|nr:GntR family transcriptional regulator [Salipiger sp. CCB-MM3]ANT62501.1 hypothetical protein AYJ57_19110 [Salipiger sp. CCB-MM3]
MSTRGQQVVRHIRDGIADGRFPGGSRMNEVEIAERFGVSRTPVRNALSALAAEGLLDYTPNAGYTVRRFTVEDISRIFRVRTELEGLAARLAAEQGLSPTGEAEMRDLLDQTARLVEAARWDDEIRETFLPLNRRLHMLVRETAQNPFLAEMIRKTNEVPLFDLIRWRWFDADLLRQSQDEHLELFDALRNRQPDRAYRIQAEHTYRSGRRMIENWSRTEAEIHAKRGTPALRSP